jgi:hypothetical protein
MADRTVPVKEILLNKSLVAHCGLYCAACGSYLKGKCPGCHENSKAGWCKVRACCIEHHYTSCADCTEFSDPNDCSKFNNFMSKMMGLILNSNRQACILKIRELGLDGYAAFMTERKLQRLPRRL